MGRRPICLVCLLLMCGMCLADWLGIPLIRGNPLPKSVQEQLAQNPNTLICGEVQRCRETEHSQSIYLKQVFTVQSERIPIRNVRVFLKTKEKVPVGAVLLVSGRLESVKAPGNPGEFDSQQYYACQHIYYFLKDGVIRGQSRNYSIWMQSLFDFREHLEKILESAAGRDASVFEAMLLGEKDNLDEALKMKYQLAGIVHIMAISGVKTLNLALPRGAKKPINWAFLRLHRSKIYIINPRFWQAKNSFVLLVRLRGVTEYKYFSAKENKIWRNLNYLAKLF